MMMNRIAEKIKLDNSKFRSYRKTWLRIAVLVMAITLIMSNSFKVGANPASEVKSIQKGRLTLMVETATGLAKVVDGRTQEGWDFRPITKEPPDEYWGKMYQSAFVIRYISEAATVETALTGEPGCRISVSSITSGYECRFDFSQLKLGFIVQYILSSDQRLRVNIPFRSIHDPQGRLLDIRCFPFFGALPFQSQGYVVWPDGCGGLITTNHRDATYNPTRIYGNRFSWNFKISQDGNSQHQRVFQLSDYRNPQNSFLNLPLFGIVRANSGLLGVISAGQFQAELGTEITPKSFLLSVSPRLIIREITYDLFGQLRSNKVFNTNDRTVDYYFLAGRDLSYVTIAKKYRDILVSSLTTSHRLETKISSGRGSNKNAFRIRLFMGVNRVYQGTKELLVATNFQQADVILNDLYRHGVRRLQVVLVGWTNRGLLGDDPSYFPPDNRFGGTHGLKKLLATGKKLRYTIGLQFDTTRTFPGNHGYHRQDTAKDIQGIPVDLSQGSREYLLCPAVAWQRFNQDYHRVRDLKIEGSLVFDGLNQGLFECYDSRHPVGGRRLGILWQKSFAKLAKENLMGTTLITDYLIPELDVAYDLPTNCSENSDQAIPLTPLIFHGLVAYSFEPLNLRRDNQREFLKMIEYGGIPNAFLTWTDVAELSEAQTNPVFSAKYSDWRKAVLKEYQWYQKNFQSLQNKTIVDHRRLAKDVYLTVYDDRTKAVVNYSNTDFVFEDRLIKTFQYAIWK